MSPQGPRKDPEVARLAYEHGMKTVDRQEKKVYEIRSRTTLLLDQRFFHVPDLQ